jgi:phosphatidylglycerophosphate synthase
MPTVSKLDSSTTTAPDLVRFSPLTHFDDWFFQKAMTPYVRIFCERHIHPNVVTVLGLAITAAIPFLHHFRYAWGVVAAAVLRQFLDCLDGEIARRCHKLTKLGGVLDSISDGVFYVSLISILVSVFTRDPQRIFLVSCLFFVCLFVIHVSICKGAALIEHSVKTYATPSLYRKSYAFMANNSLIFVIVFAIVYRLLVK